MKTSQRISSIDDDQRVEKAWVGAIVVSSNDLFFLSARVVASPFSLS
jgi:hypothetical protein